MSERMIERHRARLLATGKGGNANSGGHPNGMPSPHHQQALNPRQAALATMQSDDEHMRLFLERLEQQRDDSLPSDASMGPTVPTALSRRLLQRQGAGYLDSSVAAVTSAAADRFLATVLQQAVACRDQRLKGTETERQAARQRKRHKRQYQESVDDRRRRKEKHETDREKTNLAAMEAARALKQKGKRKEGDNASVSSAGASKSKKVKKHASNGSKRKIGPPSDDEASYDSLDQEEEYYQQYYAGQDDDFPDKDDEEDDEMMILRDLARPLQAWDFYMDGKLGMEPLVEEEDEINNNENEVMSVEDGDTTELSSQPADSAKEELAVDNSVAGTNGAANANSSAKSPEKKSQSPSTQGTPQK